MIWQWQSSASSPQLQSAHPRREGLPSRNCLYPIAPSPALHTRGLTFPNRGTSNQAMIRHAYSERHVSVDEPNLRRNGSGGGYSASAEEPVTFTTFNILAPIYKRLNDEGRQESEFREYWVHRNQGILDLLLLKRSSVICLQEFWVRNEELVDMYRRCLGDAGYEMYTLGRTNNRGDGLFTAVRKDHFMVVNNQELLFNDFGDRVAQLLHLRSVIPFLQNQSGDAQLEALIVNTHLLFPHNSNYCLVRLRQVYKILEHLETFRAKYRLPPMPIILCGDWNGSKRGHVYKFLRSQGFISSYDSAHQYTDCDVDAHRWVSHRNHRGNICGVDFIWLLNPNKDRKPLRTSWMEAVFAIIKSKLEEAGLDNLEAFCFKSEDRFDDCVTLSEFGHALQQLGLTEQLSEGLTSEEIEELMMAADIDGNGIIDNEEFQNMMVAQSMELCPITILEGKSPASEKQLAPSFSGDAIGESPLGQLEFSSTTLEHERGLILKHKMLSEARAPQSEFEANLGVQDPHSMQESDIGFVVKSASLFPTEMEQGIWPEKYFLSDHALLTAMFAPIRLPRTKEVPL